MSYALPSAAQAPGTDTNGGTSNQQYVQELLGNPPWYVPGSLKTAPGRSQIPENEYSALIRQKAAEAGLTESDAQTLIRIAWCESGLKHERWNYMNPTGDPTSKWSAYGLFQVIASHEHDGISRMTVEGNVALALELYMRNGTAPWNASISCWKR